MSSNEEQMEVDPGDDEDDEGTMYDSDETLIDGEETDYDSEEDQPGPVIHQRGQSERSVQVRNETLQQANEDSDATEVHTDYDDDESEQPGQAQPIASTSGTHRNSDQSERPIQRVSVQAGSIAQSNSQSQDEEGSQSILPVDTLPRLDQSGVRTEPNSANLAQAAVRVDSQRSDDVPGQSSREPRNPAVNLVGANPVEIDLTQDEPRQAPRLPNVHIQANLSLINTSLQSPNNFTTPKKPIPESPEKDDEAETCSICFDSWTNSGSHRLSSLKCGHLFGQSCIEKWLKGHGGKCPQCNAKAKKTDIRVLYAKAVRALDTTERDRALKELEKEKEIRRKAEVEAAQLKMQYQMALEECNKLKSQLKAHDRLISSQNRPGPSSSLEQSSSTYNGQYKLERVITTSPNGGCRIMAFDPSHRVLVVSMPSPNQLFPGYGVKKISMLDMKSSQYVTIHTKMLRDCCFNNRQDGLLLSTSIDKTVKITSLLSNTVVQTYSCNVPVWSCAWNLDDTNYIYAGLMNGSIVMYDTRNTNTEVTQFNREGSRCPIVSLHYVQSNVDSSFRCSGLLSGTLEGAQFWEKKTAAEYKPHILPLEGSCTNLSFESKTRHCLASFRPGRQHNTARHVMCELQNVQLDVGDSNSLTCTCNAVQTFYGGSSMKLLTRSRLFQNPADCNKVLACAGDESSLSAHVWDGSTGSLQQKLMANGPVLDVCPFRLNNQHMLAIMTEKIVKVHRWS
ncbi:E3 ubiquitin-protein ligase rfwd3.L-like [Ptychodera flava]|uniref:E3 ubiquitin-protein ligase rfwd3.L-like n=1 Tax=Ptychodera flava TaxID=63121 RepID=UPI00396A1113